MVLGSTHWVLVEFTSAPFAISDHPVVPWPLSERSRLPSPTPPEIGLFETLEIRVPLSPQLAKVMTWLDEPDGHGPVRGVKDLAANLNAFTVAQAEKQWFHTPSRVPPRATGQLLPVSPQLLPGYGAETVASTASVRRRSSQGRLVVTTSFAGRTWENHGWSRHPFIRRSPQHPKARSGRAIDSSASTGSHRQASPRT